MSTGQSSYDNLTYNILSEETEPCKNNAKNPCLFIVSMTILG